MTKKKQKKESIGEWSRRVFGYTKDGWLYVDNKRVSRIERDPDGDFIDDEEWQWLKDLLQ